VIMLISIAFIVKILLHTEPPGTKEGQCNL
jgi:hypothetical protein